MQREEMTVSDEARERAATLARLLGEYGAGATHAIDGLLGTQGIDNSAVIAVIALSRHESLTTRQLATVGGAGRRETAALVKELEGRALVTTRPGSVDGRAVDVVPTPRGRGLFAGLEPAFEAWLVESVELASAIVDLARPVKGAADAPESADAVGVLESMARVGVRLEERQREASGTRTMRGNRSVALSLLAQPGTWRPVDLATALDTSTAATTYVIDYLEQRGWVERAWGALPDRRGVRLDITDAGRAVVAAFGAGLLESATEIHGAWSQAVALGRRRAPGAGRASTVA